MLWLQFKIKTASLVTMNCWNHIGTKMVFCTWTQFSFATRSNSVDFSPLTSFDMASEFSIVPSSRFSASFCARFNVDVVISDLGDGYTIFFFVLHVQFHDWSFLQLCKLSHWTHRCLRQVLQSWCSSSGWPCSCQVVYYWPFIFSTSYSFRFNLHQFTISLISKSMDKMKIISHGWLRRWNYMHFRR